MLDLSFNTPVLFLVLSLLLGWFLDLFLGDPIGMPHPVVFFGKLIAKGEHLLNHGAHRRSKGALLALTLILGVFFSAFLLFRWLLSWPVAYIAVCTLTVFFCLAGTTLIREVRLVFEAVDHSLSEGRRQVARIVGRDTQELSAQEVRTAALETLAENLSDGVIAPLFWLALLGPAGMLAYKMVNTLDSMIGYRTDRYREFGCVAARIDDVANYLPARLTAFLMVIASGRLSLLRFVARNGRRHASPNSGYPEAALAGVLNCRFGGPHPYFGQMVDKPYIGDNNRELNTNDMKKAVWLNRTAEVIMLLMLLALFSIV